MNYTNSIFTILFLFAFLTSCTNDDDGNITTLSNSEDRCLVLVGEEWVDIPLDREPMYLDGGQDGLIRCMLPLISYPSLAKENGTEGTVELDYAIGRDGTIAFVSIHTDIGDGCGLESKRVLEACTQGVSFSPGEIDGQAQIVRKRLPIKFKLE